MAWVGKWRPWVALAVPCLLALAACTESLPHGGIFDGPEDSAVRPPMLWPVPGTVVSAFRTPVRPDHQGIDLAASPRSPVIAARAGDVGFAGVIPGYGNVVAIDHGDGMTTVYSHLADDTIAPQGSRVASGEVIGHVGENGFLHFEIRKQKDAVDPAPYYPSPPPLAAKPTKEIADLPREPAEPVPLESASEPVEIAAIAPPPAAPLPAAPAAPAPTGAARTSAPPPRAPSTAPPVSTAAAPADIPTEEIAPLPRVGGELPPPADREEPARATVEPAPASAPGEIGGSTTIASAPGSEMPPPLPEDAAEAEAPGAGLVAGLAAANLLYVPAKLAYTTFGGLVGGFAYLLTGGAVSEVFEETTGGDFYVTAEHLQGKSPLRFRGETG